MIQNGFVETAEIKLIAEFALDLLAQAVVSHAADEVGAELC